MHINFYSQVLVMLPLLIIKLIQEKLLVASKKTLEVYLSAKFAYHKFASSFKVIVK